MSDIGNGNIAQWIESKLFENVVRASQKDFHEICTFKVFPALGPGENYCSTMLRVELEFRMKDGTLKNQTYMLKIPNTNQHMQDQWDAWNQFETEAQMYHGVVPEFEQLYRSAGQRVAFVPKAFKLNVNAKHILLEDLTKRGFKTLKRQNGLDMEHCKSVLKKMAQWHAASAVDTAWHDTLKSKRGVLNENAKLLLDQMFNDAVKLTSGSVKKLPDCFEYHEKLLNLSSNFTETLRKTYKIDPTEFNVLNHGDCWSNNIMFQYDSEGKLQSTYFVDLQVPLYGSPAMDLYYFIISSAKLELKIAHFDEMIKYYHDNLIDNLTLLKYKRQLPSLRSIHQMLIKYGLWGLYYGWHLYFQFNLYFLYNIFQASILPAPFCQAFYVILRIMLI